MGGAIERGPDRSRGLGPRRAVGDEERSRRTLRQPHGAGVLTEGAVLPVTARLAVVALGLDMRRLIDARDVQAGVGDRRQRRHGELDDERQEAQEPERSAQGTHTGKIEVARTRCQEAERLRDNGAKIPAAGALQPRGWRG
jgi:hypothetical protein